MPKKKANPVEELEQSGGDLLEQSETGQPEAPPQDMELGVPESSPSGEVHGEEDKEFFNECQKVD